jgi:hypothetical protein
MKTELQQFKNLVKSNIFSVVFTKKDGSERKMVARFGVTKHLKGGSLKYSPEDFNYAIVFDMQKHEYRTINVNTIKSFTYEGNTYTL